MEEQESLRSLRERLRLKGTREHPRQRGTQEWVASRMNVHPSVISQYEHGTTRPRTDRLESYAKALGVSVKRLLTALAVTERQARERAATKSAMTETAVNVPEERQSQS